MSNKKTLVTLTALMDSESSVYSTFLKIQDKYLEELEDASKKQKDSINFEVLNDDYHLIVMPVYDAEGMSYKDIVNLRLNLPFELPDKIESTP